MGIVMILCPKTRRAISTGIRADRATFHSTPVFFSRTACPLCRTTHEWFAKDAWVCDSGAADCGPSFQQQVAQTFLPRGLSEAGRRYGRTPETSYSSLS
jgi:hypothetical protein